MRNVTPKPEIQLALDERVVEDEVVEYALARYQETKDALIEPRKAHKVAKEAAMVALERLALTEEKPVRVGRWRIERKVRQARDVEFHTDEKETLSIRLVTDE